MHRFPAHATRIAPRIASVCAAILPVACVSAYAQEKCDPGAAACDTIRDADADSLLGERFEVVVLEDPATPSQKRSARTASASDAGRAPNLKRTASNEAAPRRRAAAPGSAKRDGERSIYGDFSNAAFIRGGVLFAAHQNDETLDPLGQSATLGYRRRIARRGRGVVWVGPELVYFRDTEDFDVVGVEVERTFSGVGGLLTFGYGYDLGLVRPFASVGAGPLNIETEVDDTFVTRTDDELTVGYAGVVGVQTRLLDSLSLEAGYRYLGSVRTDVIGLHSVEVGVSYSF